MAITTATGQLDANLGIVVPITNGTWVSTTSTTWDNFLTWDLAPVDPLIWISDAVDAGSLGYWNIKVSTVASGDVRTFEIYTSTTGAFEGEETKTTINNGDANIQAFYGRHFRVGAFVYATGPNNNLQNMSITVTDFKLDISKSDVAFNTLPTWTSVETTATLAQARVLDIGRKVSGVVGVHITPNFISTASGGYAVPGDDFQYFEQFNFGQITMPSIVKKLVITTATSVESGCGTAFVLQNQNGDFLTTATVDVLLKVLPEQFMTQGQLLTR
jgi:hypothetical protein